MYCKVRFCVVCPRSSGAYHKRFNAKRPKGHKVKHISIFFTAVNIYHIKGWGVITKRGFVSSALCPQDHISSGLILPISKQLYQGSIQFSLFVTTILLTALAFHCFLSQFGETAQKNNHKIKLLHKEMDARVSGGTVVSFREQG